MNLGRVLEVLVIVIVVAYFASQARIAAMRWHTRQYVQTLNRPLAYLMLAEPFNSTLVRDFMLRAGGEDVVRIVEYSGVLGGEAVPGIVYSTDWPYGYYVLRGLVMTPSNYTVVEVWVRD